MSKRRRPTRKERQQQQKRQWQTIGIVAVILVGAFALIFTTGGLPGAAPDVAQARLDLDPILGNADAPVTIIEYGAYGCEACAEWHRRGYVTDILNEFNGQVNFTFRDLPVILPGYDRMAANVAQCALDQGEDAFWNFHNALYSSASPGRDSQDDLIDLAARIGLDGVELRECAEAGTHRRTVQYDQDRANDLNLRSTPSFVINGRVVFGASPELLRSTIQEALAGL